MKKFLMKRIWVFLLGLSVFPGFASSPDGLWKAVYANSSPDTLLAYTKMLLRVDGENFQLVNYDDYLAGKNLFENEGFFDLADSSLVFNKDSANQKTYKLNIVDENRLEIITREDPGTVIAFVKLKMHKLGRKKDELGAFMRENTFEFDFSFFEGAFEMEFDEGNRFMVTDNVGLFFPNFSKWAVVDFDDELFIYFSGLAPFLHVVSMDSSGIVCEDEFDRVYSASLKKVPFQQKFNKEQLFGVWEQKSVDEGYLRSMPEKLWDKEIYVRQVWEIKEESATLHSIFRSLVSPMEISRNGEMVLFLMFNELNNHQFRVLSIDEEKLVVERLNRNGDVARDTLVKQKKVPAPVKLKDFFRDNK